MSDTPQLSPVKRALLAIEDLESRLKTAEAARTEPIAVIGMACRFPGGADTPEKFWTLLAEGIDAVTEVPPERWNLADYYDPDPETPGKTYSRHGGFLKGIDRFDSWFFRISPREAASLDPQQRLLLEVGWEALEQAGLASRRAEDVSGGVFIGITTNDYAELLKRDGAGSLDAHYFTGNPMNAAAGRLAYTFGLQGPALAMDTACSSSLVSVHQACASLRNRECSFALAGGVNLILVPGNTVAVSKTRALSPDGRCKTFDRSANGFVRSEGCGLVVLKRLSDAVAAGDRILAVVRGSAVNQDGASSGFTVPNGKAQQAVIRQALADLVPSDIDYVEAHGTGTSLGDPIEASAVAEVLCRGRDAADPLYIGSVKTNIGHCEAAAGIAGLIKAILALQHEEIPPHLHFSDPSPLIPWASLPLKVPVQRVPWKRGTQPRRAGVSAFGASGTNAHLILEEPPATAATPGVERTRHLLAVSAKNAGALQDLAFQYREVLTGGATLSFPDACYSAAVGRAHFPCRVAVAGNSSREAALQLESLASSYVAPENSERRAPKIAFLFTGQGSQYAGMGHLLYKTHPAFKDSIDRASAILRVPLGRDLRDVLFSAGNSEINETLYTQPALLALECALADLLMSWGIRPAAVMGHSVGEYAAAYAAGVIGFEDALKLIAARARLMDALPRDGSMAVLAAEKEQVEKEIRTMARDVAIAAVNSPRNTVISGRKEAVAAVCARLEERGIRGVPLPVSHAFHSPLIEPMLDGLESAAREIPFRRPEITLISNLTGLPMDEAPTPGYWRSHCREAVQFARGVESLVQAGCDAFVEIGPRPTLTQLARQIVGEGDYSWLPTLHPGKDDWQVLLEAVAALYCRGVDPDWREIDRPYPRRRAALPTYPFQRARHWLKDGGSTAALQPARAPQTKAPRGREDILAVLKKHVAALLQANESEVNTHLPFLEMGADSLVMAEAVSIIEKEFGVKLAIRRFFEDLPSIDALAAHIAQTRQAESNEATSRPAEPRPAAAMPWGKPADMRARGLTPGQHRHLEDLIDRYTKRTRRSKELTQQYRPVLADSRATVGFRLSTKELLYPISGARTRGSRMWDVDGNEYIDFTMGFGVHLFGHQPEFIQPAVREEFERGVEIGARSDIAGEVAGLFTSMTGLDRVAFCNSGTEAVMASIRLARAATGRDKIVLFTNSYHGHSDGTLARAEMKDGELLSVPMMPGVPMKTAANVIVLDYGSREALDILRSSGHDIAAVLVEPVQSRHLTLQPREFLHELRRITSSTGTVLIFDEMITGFRVHPGGAQAYFGVKADLATYGKIVGGGLPIGLIAGSASIMDGIDGGMWQYGDASFPAAERTAFGGTFCQHPLAMSAARAVLTYLKAEGPALQERLNRRTDALVRSLNACFAADDVPIVAQNFSSLFRFEFSSNLDLLFYHMLERGIYIWEWRSCFLSTAHSDADLETFVRVVQESVEELRSGEYLPKPLTRRDARRRVPLSEAQKQIWLLSRIDRRSSIAYNVNTTIDLRGELNVDALQRAIQRTVDRHSALRSTLSSGGEDQLVRPHLDVALPVTDVSDADLERWRREESETPIDLLNGPLFRPALLRLDAGHHVLVLTVHHIVADGSTMGVLLKDISQFYNDAVRGSESPAPEPMQFGEYLARCAGRIESPEMNAHEAFWLKQFADGVPVTNLPLDRTRPPVKSYAGMRITHEADPALVARLRQVSREHGCTMYMTLLAAFGILLHRYCRQEDLVIGAPVTGRPFAGSQDMAGYCVHMIPIRSRIDRDLRFSDVLTRMKAVLLDAFDHQDYPFSELVRKLDSHRDAGSFPIVSAVFNLEPVSALPGFEGLQPDLLPQVVTFTAFDFFVNVIDAGERLILTADFNTDLFDESTARRILTSYETLLESASRQPSRKAMELPLLDEGERRKILVEWNRTEANYSEADLVHVLFERRAAEKPDAVAVVFEGARLSYGALNARANRLARLLQAKGIGRESLVAICAERSPELIVAMLAVLKSGGAYVPMDAEYPEERIRFMTADAGASILLTQARLADRFAGYEGEVIFLDRGLKDDAFAPDNLNSSVVPGDLAYVIYTSGSTGRPKGAMNTHRGIANLLLWSQDRYALNGTDRVLQKTAISFDLSVWELLWPMIAGASLVMARPGGQRDIEYVAELMEREKVTAAHFVPSMLRVFAELPGVASSCGALRLLISTGEALAAEVQNRVLSVFPGVDLHNAYGPTEAAVEVTYWPCRPASSGAVVPIGRPIANTELYILDESMQPVPIGVTGELFIGGANLGRGYMNRPDLNREKFVAHPFSSTGARLYRTGDLARYRPDGGVEFLGRLDHQIKIRGFRVEIGEIEAVMAEHPDVKAAVVTAPRDDGGNTQLIGYAASSKPPSEIQASLTAYLQSKLPDYMVPRALVALPELPLLPNGKLDRNRLPAVETGTRIAPSNETESGIVAIWQEVLRKQAVSVEDDFFSIGGNSLSATQVVTRLNRKLGAAIGIKDIFTYPTVRALARRVAEGSAAGVDPIGVLPPQGDYEVSHAQKRFWIQDRLADSSRGNSHPLSFVIEGPLDAGALKRAFEGLIRRHEILRTVFVVNGGQPRQKVLPAAEVHFELPRVDLRGAADADAAIQAIEIEEASKPIDLGKGPLFRARLLALADIRHVCVCNMHHIVTDGWSVETLLNEMNALYDAFAAGKADPLSPLRIQYKEFAAWQNKLLSGAPADEMRAYWLSKLGSRPPGLNLPVDFSRTAGRGYQRAMQRFQVGEENLRLLDSAARNEGATLFMALLSCIKVLLHRYTAQEDICVGTPSAGRVHRELENQIGPYLNILALRDTISPDDTFLAVLHQVRQTTLDAFAFQFYPFDRIVEDLKLKRDPLRNPLFDVGFTLQNQGEVLVRSASNNLRIAPLRRTEETGFEDAEAATDFWFVAEREGADLDIKAVYNGALFKPRTAASLLDDLGKVIAAVAEKPQLRVGAIPLTPAAPGRQWNKVAINLEL